VRSRAPGGIGLTIFRALERPILFFGGKGGVGKTTLAAATALESARRGARTLLVSTDSAHSTSDILGVNVDAQPGPVEGDLWAAEIDPASAVEDYIRDVKGRIADVTPPRLAAEVERQIDAARVSPGAEEAALFDRFTRLLGDERFDRIVFDTAPTGQTLRLLSLPELMTNWIGGLIAQRRKVSSLGRMWRNVAGAASGSEREIGDPVLAALEERRDRFERARLVLTDSGRTAFMFVTVPERLPILETHRAMSTLSGYGIPVGGLIVNQVHPAVPQDEFLRRRAEREDDQLADIRERFRDWPIAYVAMQEGEPAGSDSLRQLFQALSSSTENLA